MSARPLANAWLGTLATNTAILFCGIATGILAARLLEPEGRGTLAVLMFWPQLIAGIGLLSLNEGIVYRAPQTALNKQVFATTALCVGLALAVVTGAAGFLVLPYLLGPERADLVPLAQVYLLAFVPFNFIALTLLALDHAELRFRRYNLLRLLPSYVYLASLLLLWALGLVSAITALWGSWLGTLLTALVRLAMARHHLAASVSLADARALLSVSQRFHWAHLLFLLGSQVDRMVVVTFWDDAGIGHYIIALTVAAAGLGVVTSSFHTVLFPKIAAEADAVEKRRLLARGLAHANLLIGLGSLALLALIPWLVPSLFGAAFAPATLPAMILVTATWPMALREIIVRCLRGFGDTRAATVAEGLALGGFLTAVAPLAVAFGVAGVALALLVANVGAMLYLSVVLHRRFALPFASWHGFNKVTLLELCAAGLRAAPALKLPKALYAR